MYKLFGIPNCNTVKNARQYLEKKKISYEFVDFKKHKPTVDDIKCWAHKFGSLPVNKSGLTFKKFKALYEPLSDSAKVKFLQENTSMMKRPILVKEDKVLAFGFSEDLYLEIL